MPFINTKTNQSITPEIEQKLKQNLGKAITSIKGKSESWLMLSFEENQKMWFQGTNDPAAMVQVAIFGTASAKEYQDLTNEICTILSSELQIPLNRIYVQYSEHTHWGWNGSNF